MLNSLLSVEKRKDSFEAVVMENIRMSGAYRGLTTLDLLGKLHAVDVREVVSWVLQCQHDSGGFGGSIGHDPHVLYTLSAVQVLALFDKLDVLDIEKVASCFLILLSRLSLLHRLDKINVEKAVSYLLSCETHDGGFGCKPGVEAHSGQIFCCVGALSITGSLHHVDKDLLGWWLCERQDNKTGGLNGRPEKLPDDIENGGISDRPDDAVDVYHTCFGIAGLSLLEYPGLKAIDPAYAFCFQHSDLFL